MVDDGGHTEDREPEGAARPGVRASDAEREALVERLNAATGEGRLDLEEFSERLELAYAARTRAELEALVEDLPPVGADTAPARAAGAAAAGGAGRTSLHLTPIGGMRRRGPWRVPANTLVVTLLGGVDLDLTEAELDAQVVTIRKFSLLGGVDMVVPPGVRVEVDGFSILGGRDVEVDERAVGPGSPVLRVTAFSILGGVRIRSSRGFSRTAGAPGRDYDDLRRLREERRSRHRELHDERRELHRERRDIRRGRR